MSDPVALANFRTRFPEFAAVADARVNMALDDATLLMSPDVWDTKYPLGQAYLAAHFLVSQGALGSGTGIVGVSFPVASESVGSVSQSYAVPTNYTDGSGDELLATTSYGQQFVAIRSTLLALPLVLGG